MHRRQLPAVWMFTDLRVDVLAGLARLPKGSGIVFRHYGVPDRAALLARVAAIAKRRRLVLVIAGLAHAVRGAGVHNRRGAGIVTFAAHDRAELVAARRAGADLVFVSPVFASRSHPGAGAIGRVRFGLLVRGAKVPVAALGGMTARRFRTLKPSGAVAWGGIDAFA